MNISHPITHLKSRVKKGTSDLTSLSRHQRTARRVALLLHPVTQSSSWCTQSWTLSAIDRRRSSVDTWRRCRREIILSSEVGYKLQRDLRLCLEIFEFRICFINSLFSSFRGLWPLALDQKFLIQARPQTLCVCS